MRHLAVVALISGGKDSLFSILHCLANGHEVVALANLHPPLDENDETVDDLDSFMYQTIGHTVIPLYSEALGLPLYRQEITGAAVNQNKSYSPFIRDAADSPDETESLLPLLRKVKTAHPQVNAVSTGAILSDYQRTRVESVAIRLGLIPLSFLWQWPSLPPHTEASLLNDMASVGQDSRIVKVASGGLDDSFLWRNVAEPRTMGRLSKAAQRFGKQGDGAMLGEGGEYETLAVAGPSPLWKARIHVDDAERKVIQGEAGSSSLRITQARLVTKQVDEADTCSVRIPQILDPRFESMLEDLVVHSGEARPVITPSAASPETAQDVIISPDGGMVFLPSLVGSGECAADQMRAIMVEGAKTLARYNHSAADIVYTSIVLRDMAEFPAMNAVYGSFFTKPNPPARVTIACADVLPVSAHLMLALTSVRAPTSMKSCLHVQSRSYWAPANIGPYSQAMTVPVDGITSGLVFIAGQIPLIPSSMELGFPLHDSSPASNLYGQATLALQHLHRVGQATRVRQWASVIAFVVARNEQDLSHLEYCARRLWSVYHSPDEESFENEDDEHFDVWHATQQPTWDRIRSTAATSPSPVGPGASIPPIHVVKVDSLPRGASIEWVGYGLLTMDDKLSCGIPHLEHLQHIFKHCGMGSAAGS